MNKFKLVTLCLLALFIALAGSAEASLYLSTGKYTFNVQVRNSGFKDISYARGRVYVTGNTARIDVEADGYRSGYEYVYLRDNVTSYYAQVRLDDPTVWVNVRDDANKPIANSYVSHTSQSMYWGDEFGMRGYFPVEGFESLTVRDLEVLVNNMYAFAPRVYLTRSGNNWNFEIIVKRRDMHSMFSNRFEIIAKRDPVSEPAPAAELIAMAEDYVANMSAAAQTRSEEEIMLLHNRLESTAAYLLSIWAATSSETRSQITALLPDGSPLTRALNSINQFEDLHR
ncbi:MAG: hypothetical protein CVV42_07455 [Candidatus Riflebacteria bacterium HGW-Riflebacteria-2]|jgi:hypothetical protein|nr:MAG: hypothetical protein CVV42_07455 [Candidatus Riflebacteria bacterium HGW-Riflebacteria-2]